MTMRFSLLVLMVMAMGFACTLEDASTRIGIECDDSGDCDDDTLGCVPIDDQDPSGDRVCMPPPEDWSCSAKFYGDGVCDCGCASLDADCATPLVGSCDDDGDQCPAGKDPNPTDNTECV